MRTSFAPLLLAFIASVASAATHPRLATATTVFIEPLDTLEADRPVSLCLAEHLPAALPLTMAPTRQEADLVLRVKARVAGDTTRKLTGGLGTVQLWAVTPDGEKVWDGFRSESLDRSVLAPAAADVPCLLADTGIELLRKAMKNARDKK